MIEYLIDFLEGNDFLGFDLVGKSGGLNRGTLLRSGSAVENQTGLFLVGFQGTSTNSGETGEKGTYETQLPLPSLSTTTSSMNGLHFRVQTSRGCGGGGVFRALTRECSCLLMRCFSWMARRIGKGSADSGGVRKGAAYLL